MAYWLDLLLAFLLGAMVMGLGIFLYLLHVNKKMRFELKLHLMANGEDPSKVDEIPEWWRMR